MDRTEMLQKLSTTKFMFLEPEECPEEIGFTERELWVNSEGYGYIADDESIDHWEGVGIEKEKWDQIKEKIEEGVLEIEDIEGTSLIDMLETMYWGDYYENDISEDLRPLLELPDEYPERIFCMRSELDLVFFSSHEAFQRAFERDWCNYYWEELNDSELAKWVDVIFNKKACV